GCGAARLNRPAHPSPHTRRGAPRDPGPRFLVLTGATRPGVGGEFFRIATNTETTVLELADKLAAVVDRNGALTGSTRHREPRAGDVRHDYAGTRKAGACSAGLRGSASRTVSSAP